MFPIPWNFPFRKKNGDVTTIGEMVDSGGGGGSELPPHTIADAGKVLGVDDTGALAWVTVSGGSNFASVAVEPDALNPTINAKEGV